ncbi:DUF998 domain-containing protein [Luedemannella flava]|uniref:DUF998 domain-containing protein n=1 Tax=Luedemannella flava TaxID=349316 RepID=A0ABP4YZZ7_9ACTN
MSIISADVAAARPAAGARTLLVAGVAAAPTFAVVSVAHAATRDGFDLTRHPLSMLSTGDLGWLQVATFVVSGLLLIAGAAGLRAAIPSRWAPRLLTVTGLGMIAAGAFPMDPGDGFPVGTPAGPATSLSWHAGLHMVAGTVSFAALTAACLVLGRHFARAGRTAAAGASWIAGATCVTGNVWAMMGGRAGSLTVCVGVLAAMFWVSATQAAFVRGS